jgi:DNA processing protein
MSSEHGVLTLLGLRGIGRGFVRGALGKNVSLGSPDQIFNCLGPAQLKNIQREDVERSWNETGITLSKASERNISLIAWDSAMFPNRLKEIPDAPALIYVVGDVEVLLRLSVAVIGTRHPSEFGEKAGRKIAKTLAENGIVVVSGLAEGCDTAAHVGCLEGGGKTVAVLAHGFGEVYPKSNEPLADQILKTGGCLVSEYSPGTPIRRSSFVERDRLQSGLSEAVIVIETDVEGGTMHTVSFSEKQGRMLAAVQHPPEKQDHPKSRGNAMLIDAERAKALADATDLKSFIENMKNPISKTSKGSDQLGLLIE